MMKSGRSVRNVTLLSLGALLLLAQVTNAKSPLKNLIEQHKNNKAGVGSHSHLARKVLDRACAATKDTIDEVFNCMLENDELKKTVKPTVASDCYKDAFGTEFDHNDRLKHKEMICNNREKFEGMTSCVYRATAESLGPKGLEKMSDAMVDVGLCIVNALDS